MKNQVRLSFYNKKILFIFKSFSFVLVCPKQYLNNIISFLQKENYLNIVSLCCIKKRSFYFFFNLFLKNINSSDLVLCYFNNMNTTLILKILNNISFYYLFYNSFFFNYSLNFFNLNILKLSSFFVLLYWTFFVFPLFIYKK